MCIVVSSYFIFLLLLSTVGFVVWLELLFSISSIVVLPFFCLCLVVDESFIIFCACTYCYHFVWWCSFHTFFWQLVLSIPLAFALYRHMLLEYLALQVPIMPLSLGFYLHYGGSGQATFTFITMGLHLAFTLPWMLVQQPNSLWESHPLVGPLELSLQ